MVVMSLQTAGSAQSKPAYLLPLFLAFLVLTGSGCAASSTEKTSAETSQAPPPAYTDLGKGVYSFDDEDFGRNLATFRGKKPTQEIIAIVPEWTNGKGGVTRWLVVTKLPRESSTPGTTP